MQIFHPFGHFANVSLFSASLKEPLKCSLLLHLSLLFIYREQKVLCMKLGVPLHVEDAKTAMLIFSFSIYGFLDT